MAECKTCVAAIGMVTNISTGNQDMGLPVVTTQECPECKGYGTTCGRCLKDFDRCRCPEPKPKPKDKEWWEDE